MRKILVLAAIAALIAAVAGIWSTATFDGQKVAGQVQATEAPGAPVSPHAIMVKQGRIQGNVIVGAGLPGLILACGGLLGWWRRRQKSA